MLSSLSKEIQSASNLAEKLLEENFSSKGEISELKKSVSCIQSEVSTTASINNSSGLSHWEGKCLQENVDFSKCENFELVNSSVSSSVRNKNQTATSKLTPVLKAADREKEVVNTVPYNVIAKQNWKWFIL